MNSRNAIDSGGRTRVGIVGGGLAGLAAAIALCDRGFDVEVFEAKKRLGGRATSLRDPESGELIDNCQHVAMGCCTNFLEFSRSTGTDRCFRRCRTLHFFGPDGRRFDLRPTALLPAPLHLAASLLRMGYLSLGDRVRIARSLVALARTQVHPDSEPSIGEWLIARGESERARDRFWSVVLVSALSESIDRASLSAARKVFVDGFFGAREAYEMYVPDVPLGELYPKISNHLNTRGARVHLESPVEQLSGSPSRVTGLSTRSGETREFDFVVLGVSWRRIGAILGPDLANAIDVGRVADSVESSPITSLHLWFDRLLDPLDHAVFVDRLSQWVFRAAAPSETDGGLAYYQIVISASRQLRDRSRDDVLNEVIEDLRSIWPATANAKLARWRMLTEHDAVFSVRPGLDLLRPDQRTAVPNLMLCGDWTKTGWPATMESAVLSGFRATEAILEAVGRPESIVAAPLQRSWLARLLIANA